LLLVLQRDIDLPLLPPSHCCTVVSQ
jgi:hypothetical protein